MSNAVASPRLAGFVALLSAAATVPFVWVHLVGGRPDNVSRTAAATEQLLFNLALPAAEKWKLIVFVCLPILWLSVATGYLAGTSSKSRVHAFMLVFFGAFIAAASTYTYGLATAPLFVGSPLLGLRLAVSLHMEQ